MAVGRMNEVELVEEPAVPGSPDRADRSRVARRARVLRVLRRWWPLAAGIVTAVVVAQVVADRQQRAEAEHRRETDGVLQATVDAPLEATGWESELADLALSGIRTPDGLVAGVVVPAAVGAPSFVAVDPATGRERWRVDVGDASPGSGFGGCTLVTEPSPVAWCLLYRAASRDGDAVVLAPRVIGVGVEERAVLETRDLPPEAGVGIVGSTLVVTSPAAPGTEVQATDLATGDVRWTVTLDDPLSDGAGVGVGVAGDLALVAGGTGTWVLDLATGGAVEVPGGVTLTRVGRVAVVQDARASLLDVAGGAEQEIPGSPLAVRPDDGTAGDVLLVRRDDGSAGGVLVAVDARTGATLWERDGWDPAGRLVLLDGVLYGAAGSSLWAVDARTGDERWSTATGLAGGELMTDGRSLMRAEQDAGSGGAVLAAYDLEDGARAWVAPLPDGVTSVWTSAGTLFGRGAGSGVFTIG